MVKFPYTVIYAMLTMYPKLEWLVNHILSFSQSAHKMLGTYIDYHPMWGLLKLIPVKMLLYM